MAHWLLVVTVGTLSVGTLTAGTASWRGLPATAVGAVTAGTDWLALTVGTDGRLADQGSAEIRFEGEQLYDSVKGGPHGSGTGKTVMFVIYDKAQAYPRFVVSF